MLPYCLYECVSQDYLTKPGLCIAMRRVCNRLVNHRSLLPDERRLQPVPAGICPKACSENVLLNDAMEQTVHL